MDKKKDRQRNLSGRCFGHLAYEMDNIYAACQHLMDNDVTINRPLSLRVPPPMNAGAVLGSTGRNRRP